MNYKVRTESIIESNEFLRCLWATFEEEFGKCAWQFMPYKIGEEKRVFFGFMDIGSAGVYKVSIIYHKKGCIEELILDNEKPVEESILKRISDCVKQAIGYKTIVKTYFGYRCTLKSYNRLLPYHGGHFKIEPTKDERYSNISFG